VSKIATITLHIGSHHQTFYDGDRPCFLCQETKDDWKHVLCCPSLDADYQPSRLMAESQTGHANVASPCRILESNRKRNPTPLTRINQPAFTLPNSGQPNQKSSPSSLQRTKLNQVDEHLKGPRVIQVAEICHHTCPLEMTGLASPRAGPKFVTAMWDHSLQIW
jgi:hypothetical protein